MTDRELLELIAKQVGTLTNQMGNLENEVKGIKNEVKDIKNEVKDIKKLFSISNKSMVKSYQLYSMVMHKTRAN